MKKKAWVCTMFGMDNLSVLLYKPDGQWLTIGEMEIDIPDEFFLSEEEFEELKNSKELEMLLRRKEDCERERIKVEGLIEDNSLKSGNGNLSKVFTL